MCWLITSEPNLRAWRRWPPWLYSYLPIPWELSQFLFNYLGFVCTLAVLLHIWLIAECWYVEKVFESEFEKAWAEFVPFWMVKYQSINCLVYELNWLGYRHTLPMIWNCNLGFDVVSFGCSGGGGGWIRRRRRRRRAFTVTVIITITIILWKPSIMFGLENRNNYVLYICVLCTYIRCMRYTLLNPS